jgi:hypothetical protein
MMIWSDRNIAAIPSFIRSKLTLLRPIAFAAPWILRVVGFRSMIRVAAFLITVAILPGCYRESGEGLLEFRGNAAHYEYHDSTMDYVIVYDRSYQSLTSDFARVDGETIIIHGQRYDTRHGRLFLYNTRAMKVEAQLSIDIPPNRERADGWEWAARQVLPALDDVAQRSERFRAFLQRTD